VLESDSEDESFVKKTTYPAVSADASLLKKRKRYITWDEAPEQMQVDIAAAARVAVAAREEFAGLERDEERWAGACGTLGMVLVTMAGPVATLTHAARCVLQRVWRWRGTS